MDLPIRKPARRAEPGKRAERSEVPLFAPLKQVSGLLAWADADPRNAPDYACGLVSATAEAVLSAMKNGRSGGWIFVQENFIRAVRAIRDMNDARGTAYTDRDLEERFPAAWSRMADAVETCARVVPRPCTGVRRIPRDVLGCPAETPEFGWSRPIRGDALQGLFDYCLETAKAALTSPTDRATVEDNYKSGVFNDREENRRTLSLHTNMLHKAAQDHARIEEKLDSVAAKLDSIGADAKRGADAAEANGAKLDELAQWHKKTARLGEQRNMPNITPAMKEAAVDAWYQYADGLRAKGKRPSWRGCLDEHGADVIYTSALKGESFQLIQIAPDEAALHAMVHNAQVKQSAKRTP